MKYPFAGVDPFIEYENWPGFHLLMCAELIRQLNLRLPDGFICRGKVDPVTKTVVLADASEKQRFLEVIN